MKKMAYIVTLALLSTLSTALFAQEEPLNQPPEPPQVEQLMSDEKPIPPPNEKRMNRKNRPPREDGKMTPNGMRHQKGELNDGKMRPPADGMDRPQRGKKMDKIEQPRAPRMNKKMRELIQKAKTGDAAAKEELKKCVDDHFTKRVESAEKQLKKQEAELMRIKNHVKEITANREAKVNEITEKMLAE